MSMLLIIAFTIVAFAVLAILIARSAIARAERREFAGNDSGHAMVASDGDTPMSGNDCTGGDCGGGDGGGGGD